MSLQVIGAGFGRTSTNSLKVALEKLGYSPCHHMKEVMPRVDQIAWFVRAADGDAVDWEEVFSGFGAAVDWPASKYHKELAAQFPEAKIILSARDVDSWYESTKTTIFALTQSIPSWLRWVSPRVRAAHRMVTRTVWEGVFDGRFQDEAYAKQVYLQHIEDVKAYYPPDRLLVHRAADGWEPLCEFLEKDIPAEPYPRVNEAEEIQRLVRFLRAINYLPWLLILLALFIWLS